MISIIIPTLQEEKLIASRIQNLKQLLMSHEIIVSDGKSLDQTVDIAKEFANKVIVQQESVLPNPARQRNYGATLASGELLVFLDASSWIEDPNAFFTHAIAQFDDPNLVALSAKLNILPEFETIADKFFCGVMNFIYIFWTNTLGLGSAQGKFQMMRKNAFRQVGGYNSNFATGEDVDLFRKLSKIGRTKIDTVLTVYHPGRREHALGWLTLLMMWTKETLSIMLRGRPISKEWKPIR